MTIQDAKQLITDLYRHVDGKNVNALNELLSEEVSFRLGNGDEIIGKNAVLAANANFFSSITSMHHSIADIVSLDDKLFCHGEVDYIRLDGSHCSAYFSTMLVLENNKIRDYLVFADISAL